VVIRSKTTILIIIVILLSSLAFSFTITSFTTGNYKELIFNGMNTENVTIDIWGDSYVLNTSFVVEGMISEWVTEEEYKISYPVDSEIINDFIIAIATKNNIQLINRTNQNHIIKQCSLSSDSDIIDIDYLENDLFLVTERDKNIVYKLNLSTCKKLINKTILSPIDSKKISSDIFATVSSTQGILYVYNITSGEIIKNYTGLGNPTSLDYLSNNLFLISNYNQDEVLLINLTTSQNYPNSIIKKYSNVGGITDAKFVSENLWLIIDTKKDEKVFLINITSDSTYPNNIIESYNGVNTPVKVEYITSNKWLITDNVDGSVKTVSLNAKYYPTDLTLDIGNDGSKEWSMAGEFNTSLFLNQNNFSEAINSYLENTCNDLNNNCTIPFMFSSATHGKLNVSNLNIQINRKPIITITSPNGGEIWTGTKTISWNAEDPDGDLIIMNISYWNSTEWVLINTINGTTGVYNYTWDTKTAPDSNATKINITATDNISPKTEDTSDNTFIIDNTKPKINFINPTTETGKYSQNWITATINAEDSNLKKIIIKLYDNTLALINSKNNSNSPFSFNFTNLAEGIYYLNATAEDLAGNKNHTETREIILDTTPPTINFNPQTTNKGIYNQNWINTSVNSNDLYLSKTTIKLYNTTGIIQTIESTNHNFINLTDGIYYLNATAEDLAGNKNHTETREIILDTTPPTITLIKPTNGASQTNQNINFTYDVNDLTKINCTLILNGVEIENKENLSSGTYGFERTLPIGTHTWNITCTDSAGINKTSQTRKLTINAVISSGGGGGGGYKCTEAWTCTEWSACSTDGLQTRTCTDLNNCRVQREKPSEIQECVYSGSFFGSLLGTEETEEKTDEEKQNDQDKEKTGEGTEQKDKGLPGITGAVTGGIFSTTTGKIGAILIAATIFASAVLFIKSKFKKI
jgi:hypothetical protein